MTLKEIKLLYLILLNLLVYIIISIIIFKYQPLHKYDYE
jgi:hypothetical protein